MEPDFAIRRERHADGPAGDRNDLDDAIALRVDDDDAVVVAMRVIELVGARLDLEVMAALQQQIDFLQHAPRLDVVHDDAGDVGVLDADVQLAVVGGERHAVRRGRRIGRTRSGGAAARSGARRPLEVLALDAAFFHERRPVEDLDERRRRHRREDRGAVGGDRRFVRLIGRDELVEHRSRRGIEIVNGVVRVAEDDDGVRLCRQHRDGAGARDERVQQDTHL